MKRKKKSRQGKLRGEEKSNWFHQSSIFAIVSEFRDR